MSQGGKESEGLAVTGGERSLMAQRFDPRRLELEGDAVPIAEDVLHFPNFGNAIFSASDGGVLTYQKGSGGGLSRLVWFDRNGKELGTVGSPSDYLRPRISPDGRRIAVDIIDPQSGFYDIWIQDLIRGTSTRFTFEAGNDSAPLWSPDGKQLVFTSVRKTLGDLYQKPASGTGSEELLVSSKEFKVAYSWSADGRYFSFTTNDPKSKFDIWAWPVAEKKAFPVVNREFNEVAPYLSPDAQWLAYVSDESGRNEVYVQPFPDATGKWQVSTSGGTHPVWSRNGKEIFYVAPDEMLMVVEVSTSPAFEAGQPRPLFRMKQKTAQGPALRRERSGRHDPGQHPHRR